MAYQDTLTAEQKKNAITITERLVKKGITNPFDHAGLLSVVSKESAFIPRSESGYGGTSNQRIRDVFGSRVSGLSDAALDVLKKDDAKFFDQVYGAQWTSLGLGNKDAGDGYKYRGRGYNQLTGRYAYEKYAKRTGHDLVNNPDLMNRADVAADVMIEFFKDRFSNPSNQLKLYNSTGINDFKNVQDSTGAYYHANAGWGKSKSQIEADPTGGRKKAMERAIDLLAFVGEPKKKISITTIVITTVLIVSTYILITNLKKK